MTEKYIMMDLDDKGMKHLAEVLANESCKKILDLLAEKEASETEIANELKVPLNTIDYNIKKLVSAGLIETSKHWWSVKGKKIPTYKVSNKKIIISPRTSRWKSIVPAVFLTGVVSVLVKYYMIAQEAAPLLQDKVMEAASTSGSVPILASSGNTFGMLTNSGNWLWFLAGGLVALIIFMVLNWRRL